MEEWLIKWNRRDLSREVHDNFLWHSDNLYIMDNHRLALWCWWQHLDKSPKWRFLHIDRHYDAQWQISRPWLKHYKPKHKQKLESFRRAQFSDDLEDQDLYRWDTITSALRVMHDEKIDMWEFATADQGDRLEDTNIYSINPWTLPGHLSSMADPTMNEIPSIIDIDIDYFTYYNANGSYGRVFSDNYIRKLGAALMKGLKKNTFGVITIALSPETTGSWELAERLCWMLLDKHPSLSEVLAGAPR